MRKTRRSVFLATAVLLLLVLLIGIYQMNLLPEATLFCCPTMEKRRFRVLRR